MEQIFGGGILWTLLIGFLAGLLARALKPGDDKLGFFMTIVLGIMVAVATIIVLQLWLFTASVNAYLGGDTSVLLPAVLVSLACLGLNLGLLRYLYGLDH